MTKVIFFNIKLNLSTTSNSMWKSIAPLDSIINKKNLLPGWSFWPAHDLPRPSGHWTTAKEILKQRGKHKNQFNKSLKTVKTSDPSLVLYILHTTYHCCLSLRVCVSYLVYLLPAILIYAADLCMIMQQQLAAVRVSSNHRAVIERSQPPAVFIVRWRTQVQQRLVGGGRGRYLGKEWSLNYLFSSNTHMECELLESTFHIPHIYKFIDYLRFINL